MSIKRRELLKIFGISALSTPLISFSSHSPSHGTSPNIIIKPPRLRIGDTVGLISPAGIVDTEDIQQAQKTLGNLGLKIKLGKHILDRYGYLAGKDIDRAADVNHMFADKSVTAIIAMRGGWGCNRILPLLKYHLIRSHPKIIMGYSDITSLLLAINARSRIVTFHGPVAISSWNQFTLDYLQPMLLQGKMVPMKNPLTTEVRRRIINPGIATGKLVGGNLSVVCAMVGSPYLPSWNRRILFVEDIGEDIYRVDRMLTQLKNAGILSQLSGFIFGQCTRCSTGDDPSLTLMEVLNDHIKPLGIPAWYAAMIGHIQDKFTMPIGVNVEIDANQGEIRMLEPAVV
ncbi:MAG: LD-carboxypeptidase [Calothrix sp. MO_167.B42]|nr:LD-carboxypeptidase [Calothrix sp. MO_167.B42]